MTSAYILIAAILLLGGLIAALGDRIGSKIGKARLRLFKLRPRQTAIVITVFTGTTIAASTLGILFGLSESLRKGVFELDDILKKRRQVGEELLKVTEEKKQVEQELLEAKTRQTEAQKRLDLTRTNFEQAQTQLKRTSSQANNLRQEIRKSLVEREKLSQQRDDLQAEIARLKPQITQLQNKVEQRDLELKDRKEQLVQQEEKLKGQARQLALTEEKITNQDRLLESRKKRLQELENQQQQLQTKINSRDESIRYLDKEIAAKNKDLQNKEKRVENLTTQLQFLQKEVEILAQYYQNYQELRGSKIALLRGQVLASGAIRIVEPNASTKAIDLLLTRANSKAIQVIDVGKNDPDMRVVQITKAQVEQLSKQLQDGRDYIVRIISAGNYVQGEKEVRVFADVQLNRAVFQQGDAIATISLDSQKITPQDIQKAVDSLLANTQFSARSAGIIGEIQVENGSVTTLLSFIDRLNQNNISFEEIKAIAIYDTSTAGPLKVRLLALRDGKIILST